MIDVSVDIDTAAVERINAMLDRVAKESPKRLAAETRRAAIYICTSLRARTKKAPKRTRANEWSAEPSLKRPQYLSRSGRMLRRWSLTRKLGTPAQYTRDHYVYTNAHRGKGGKMVGSNQGAEKRELIRLHGGIPRAGLAKKSWGWVMKAIYNGAPAGDTSWKRTKGERRDPRQFVRGIFERTASGAFAHIHNALDYIFAAVAPGAVDQSVEAAANRLEHNIQRHIERATA